MLVLFIAVGALRTKETSTRNLYTKEEKQNLALGSKRIFLYLYLYLYVSYFVRGKRTRKL